MTPDDAAIDDMHARIDRLMALCLEAAEALESEWMLDLTARLLEAGGKEADAVEFLDGRCARADGPARLAMGGEGAHGPGVEVSVIAVEHGSGRLVLQVGATWAMLDAASERSLYRFLRIRAEEGPPRKGGAA